MKAIVTGSNGFLGSHLVDRLLKEGHEVVALVRPGSNTHFLDDAQSQAGFRIVRAKIGREHLLNNQEFLKELKTTDWLFHAAGAIAAKNPTELVNTNVHSTLELAQVCSEQSPKLKKFVYVSSLAAVGPGPDGASSHDLQTPQPLTAYGRSKLQAETSLSGIKSRLNWVGIRPPAIYGPRDSGFMQLAIAINRGLLPMLGTREQRLALTHVDDVVSALIAAAQAQIPSGHSFLIADLVQPSTREVGLIMAKILGKKPIPLMIPRGPLKAVAMINEVLGKMRGQSPMFNRDKVNELVHPNWTVNDQRAREMLGYQPKIQLEEGLRQTLVWAKSHGVL